MIRDLFIALLLGAGVGWMASRQSGAAAGVLVGLLSAAGMFTLQKFSRARVRARQGAAPEMRPGEQAILHGPVELVDEGGSARAWAYLSNQRLLVAEEGGSGRFEAPLRDIEELRPLKEALFSSEVSLVAKGRGLVKLKVPGGRRWHAALQGALRGAA